MRVPGSVPRFLDATMSIIMLFTKDIFGDCLEGGMTFHRLHVPKVATRKPPIPRALCSVTLPLALKRWTHVSRVGLACGLSDPQE